MYDRNLSAVGWRCRNASRSIAGMDSAKRSEERDCALWPMPTGLLGSKCDGCYITTRRPDGSGARKNNKRDTKGQPGAMVSADVGRMEEM